MLKRIVVKLQISIFTDFVTKIPNGAGKQKCASQDCKYCLVIPDGSFLGEYCTDFFSSSYIGTKVGVPVCLFDSDPEQPTSLYLRSGLCFTCQRILNEKRRTQRKRKSDMNPSHVHGVDGSALHLGPPGGVEHYPMDSVKRFRLGGEILDLNPDAIIINGPLEDTKSHGPGYEFPEIGQDLHKITNGVFEDTCELTNTVNSLTEIPCDVNSQEHTHILGLYEKAFVSISKGIFLLNQWKASWDSVIANAAAEKSAEHFPNADVIASAAAVAAAQSVSNEQNSSDYVPLLMEKRQTEQSGNIELKNDDEEEEDEGKPEIYGV